LRVSWLIFVGGVVLLVFDARPAVVLATAENISSNKFGPFNLRSIAAFVSSMKRGSSVVDVEQ